MAKMLLRSGEREFTVEISGAKITVDGAAAEPSRRADVVADNGKRWVFLNGDVFEFDVQTGPAISSRKGKPGHAGSLSSPMPATVVRVDTVVGASVKRGDTLLVLEAMKMELPIRATNDGTVSAVHCRVGELVQPGVALVEIDA